MSISNEVISVAALRAAERAAMATTPEAELMDRAAAAVAKAVIEELAARDRPVERAKVVVLAGSGNNGGDAMLAGALLGFEDAELTVIGVGSTLHERGMAACERQDADVLLANAASGLRAAMAAMAEADVVIDGIAGLGSTGGLRAPADALVAAIPSEALVVAVDIPSGLDADGDALPATHVVADVTVTFTAPKRCLVASPASGAAGRVIIADVGIDLG